MTCSECQAEFNLNVQEQDLRRRLAVPEPQRCAQCRLKRRLAFWPFGKFHQRSDSLTKQTIISVFGDNTRFPVTHRSNWFSDSWEAPQQKIDWNRSFFDQFQALQEAIPHFHMLGDDHNVNCDYADDVWSCKDCYYGRSMYKVENSHYMYRVINTKDSLDCTYSFDLENCYKNTYCVNNYNTHFALDSRNCIDSWFLYDCRGVKNSFMCWNLRNKEYCIRNQQLSPQEYVAALTKIDFSSNVVIQQLKTEWQQHRQIDAMHRVHHQNKCEHSVGNYLDSCSNVTDTFFTEQSENCQHMFRNHQDKDCLNNTGLLIGELCYETVQSTELYNVKFASLSMRCRDSEYLDECVDVSDCFGCVGLKKKKFCILNRQYSESDYWQLKEKLITTMKARGEYSEFFPQALMYTEYDQSFASFYFSQSDQTTQASNDRPFKVIDQEKEFYQRHGLPLPQLHPDERNLQRFRQMAGIVPHVIQCYLCRQLITTYYGSEFGYKKIVCEECYKKSIY